MISIMKKFHAIIVLGAIILVIIGAYWFMATPAEETPTDENGSKHDLIRVYAPQPLDIVTSPLIIRGEARGMWYFEATFGVRMQDANGNDIPLDPAYIMTENEWMTEDFVSFETTHTFSAPDTETGTLIFERSNPSGLPENADELRVPIRFDTDEVSDRTIQLYYYDPNEDTDADGNILCSASGLVAVERTIPMTQTPVQDAVRLLLRGELTSEEEDRGVTTEYPLEGLELTEVSGTGETLTLHFDDPNNTTSGGSCRAGILWLQILETAKQFDGVEEVQFSPEFLFQP